MTDLRLLIITGNPGAGKTELAENLETIAGDGWEFVHGDRFIPEVQRRYPDQPWPAIRPYLAGISAEGIGTATNAGRQVVYDGVVLNLTEVRTLSTAVGVSYPDPSVALLELACSEDTVVARRLWIPWDQFGVPTTKSEIALKERVIRDHHRLHTPTGLDGAHRIVTDALTSNQTFRAVLRWLVARNSA